jgi:acyl transferase domain-containing protein
VNGSTFSPDARDAPRLAFLYNARDSVWGGMAPHLYGVQGALRESLAVSEAEIQRRLGWSLERELTRCTTDAAFETAQHILEPALTAVQIALTDAWRERGVLPDAVGGCSCGELAAGYARGVLSHADALELACRVSRMFQRSEGLSRIIAISWPVGQVEPLVERAPVPFHIAADGWADVTIIACRALDLAALLAFLKAEGAIARLLPISLAAHSPLVDDLADEFTRPLESGDAPRTSRVPGYSLSGTPSPDRWPSPAYWWGGLRRRLQVRQNLGRMVADGYTVFLEIGGRLAFTTALREAAIEFDKTVVSLPTMRWGESAAAVMEESGQTLASLELVRSTR